MDYNLLVPHPNSLGDLCLHLYYIFHLHVVHRFLGSATARGYTLLLMSNEQATHRRLGELDRQVEMKYCDESNERVVRQRLQPGVGANRTLHKGVHFELELWGCF